MLANLIKKILFLAAVLSLSALTSLVKAYEVRDFVFELQGNKAKITNYLGSESTLTIPMYLDGFEVTIIGQNAFNSKGLDSVSFPGSIQIIETRAFANNYLMNINFSDALIEIGDPLFKTAL